MKILKQFIIPFKGLNLGQHSFEWKIDKLFFEALENEDILDCDLNVILTFVRKERMLILDFEISGNLVVNCDRCYEEMDFPIKTREHYYIKIGEAYHEESEEVLVIPESEYQVDVSGLLFDYISLSIPIKKVHPEGEDGKTGCNKEVIMKLEENNSIKHADPRWEALKNIQIDNNN